MRKGCRPDEARFRALREFGGVDQRKEECRDARGLGIAETVTQDMRYAWRTLRRTPGFALLGVLVMALGIGANTRDLHAARSSAAAAVARRRIPERLVRLRWAGEFNALGDVRRQPAPIPSIETSAIGPRCSAACCRRFRVPLSVGRRDRTELVDGELVSGNYFDVLGVGPAAGRVFNDRRRSRARLSSDCRPQLRLLDRLRSTRDPAVVGQPLTIAGLPFTIVGVSQRGFDGVELGYSPKIRVPMAMKVQLTQGFFAEFFNLENRRAFWTQAFARARAPGIDREQAQASLQPLFHSILERTMSRGPGFEQATAARVKNDFLRSTLALDPGSQGRSSLARRLRRCRFAC